jgi:DNA repair protein RadC
MKSAILSNAASIIVGHNHPSGKTEPSREDIEVTKRLVEAGKIIGIEVLDHIIVGDETFTSLKEKGYI